MSKKIKLELYQHGNILCGRVLEMPDELRDIGIIIENEEFQIISEATPELDSKTLHLRGSYKGDDGIWFYNEYYSIEEATKAKNNIETLIEQWNEEHKYGYVLTKKEKEYLSNIIAPFKDRVIYIKKAINNNPLTFYYTIRIKLGPGKNFLNNEYIDLPAFNKDDLYAGMDPNQKYTLKELGII